MKPQVVLLSYNHPDLTARALNSILKKFKSDEVILVHNGSSPENVRRLLFEFADVEHLVLRQNLGFSGGANVGLERAFERSSWCFFVTNDCELESFELQRPLSAGLYAPRIFRRQTGVIDSIGGAVDLTSGHLQHFREIHPGMDPHQSSKPQTSTETVYAPGTAFLIHRLVFESLRGFDISLGTYWEDVDLALRAHERGWPVQAVASIVLRHGIGKTCHKDPYYTSYLFHRNRGRVCRRHLSLSNPANRLRLELILFKCALVQIFRAARSLDRTRFHLSWRAYFGAFARTI